MMGPMPTPGRLALQTGLVAALACTPLSGCALLDGSSRLEESLEYLPSGATTVTFVDRAAVAERVGDGDPETAYGTELARWTEAMADAAFDDSDVEWEAVATGDGSLGRVWKMSDDLDFDAVADDLEDAGFERSGPQDRPTFTADLAAADENGLVGGRYPAVLLSLALVPDEEVIVSGPDVDALLDVVEDDADSLADAGSFGDLLDKSGDQDDLEHAALTLEPSCGASGRISPEQAAQQYGGLLRPAGMGLFATADAVTGVRLLPDEKEAVEDAEGLVTYLDERADTTGFDAELDVRGDGPAVVAEARPADRRTMVQAWLQGDGPFACPT